MNVVPVALLLLLFYVYLFEVHCVWTTGVYFQDSSTSPTRTDVYTPVFHSALPAGHCWHKSKMPMGGKRRYVRITFNLQQQTQSNASGAVLRTKSDEIEEDFFFFLLPSVQTLGSYSLSCKNKK